MAFNISSAGKDSERGEDEEGGGAQGGKQEKRPTSISDMFQEVE